jgi:hypothetical protein
MFGLTALPIDLAAGEKHEGERLLIECNDLITKGKKGTFKIGFNDLLHSDEKLGRLLRSFAKYRPEISQSREKFAATCLRRWRRCV